MRPEQYRRKGPGGEREPLLGGGEPSLGKGRRLSKGRIELGAAGANGVSPNLRKELGSLCPLFVLIFVEVGALGLPIAVLPIITTTEFAQQQYGAPQDLFWLNTGGVCSEGTWTPATTAQIADNVEPTAPLCTRVAGPNDGATEGALIPDEQATEPCCSVTDEGSHLAYPVDSCPTGLDGFCGPEGASGVTVCALPVESSNYYYPYLEECTNGNGWAAGAISYSDAARNVLTFFAAGAIGAISDSRGRWPMFLIAEVVASLPNLMLYLWWILEGDIFSIYIYYVVRSLSGLMSSVAVGVAFVADKTSEENRAVCIGVLIAIAAIGFITAPIGVAVPYTYAFAASNIMNAFTIVWTFFMIKESLPPEKREPLVWANVNPLRSMGEPPLLSLASGLHSSQDTSDVVADRGARALEALLPAQQLRHLQLRLQHRRHRHLRLCPPALLWIHTGGRWDSRHRPRPRRDFRPSGPSTQPANNLCLATTNSRASCMGGGLLSRGGGAVADVGFACGQGLIKPLIQCMGERGVIIFGIAAGLPYYVGLALTSFDGRAPPRAPRPGPESALP